MPLTITAESEEQLAEEFSSMPHDKLARLAADIFFSYNNIQAESMQYHDATVSIRDQLLPFLKNLIDLQKTISSSLSSEDNTTFLQSFTAILTAETNHTNNLALFREQIMKNVEVLEEEGPPFSTTLN